jgi:hypothetical protein
MALFETLVGLLLVSALLLQVARRVRVWVRVRIRNRGARLPHTS